MFNTYQQKSLIFHKGTSPEHSLTQSLRSPNKNNQDQVYKRQSNQKAYAIKINQVHNKSVTRNHSQQNQINYTNSLNLSIRSVQSATQQKLQSSQKKSSGYMRGPLSIKNKVSYLNQCISTPKKIKILQPQTAYSKQATISTHMINSFREVQTIETKYNQSIKSINIQQSEVVFKGSRDVKDIVPLRLIYDDQQSKSTFNFHLIRKSSPNKLLIRQRKTRSIFGLIKLKQNQKVIHCNNSQAIQIFYESSKYILIQPYQYTLKQLISMGSISIQNYSIVLEKLKIVLKILFQQYYSKLYVSNLHSLISEHIYYVHGKFKILPIIIENSIQGFYNFHQQLSDHIGQIVNHK